MWLCTNRTSTLWVRLRHEVGDLDGHPPVNAHLLHHLVEEVFSLGVGAGLEDGLEVVQERQDVRPVERGEAEVRGLGLQVGPVGLDLPPLIPERLDVRPEGVCIEAARLERLGVPVDLLLDANELGGGGDKLLIDVGRLLGKAAICLSRI
jgi:hypothetical protein